MFTGYRNQGENNMKCFNRVGIHLFHQQSWATGLSSNSESSGGSNGGESLKEVVIIGEPGGGLFEFWGRSKRIALLEKKNDAVEEINNATVPDDVVEKAVEKVVFSLLGKVDLEKTLVNAMLKWLDKKDCDVQKALEKAISPGLLEKAVEKAEILKLNGKTLDEVDKTEKALSKPETWELSNSCSKPEFDAINKGKTVDDVEKTEKSKELWEASTSSRSRLSLHDHAEPPSRTPYTGIWYLCFVCHDMGDILYNKIAIEKQVSIKVELRDTHSGSIVAWGDLPVKIQIFALHDKGDESSTVEDFDKNKFKTREGKPTSMLMGNCEYSMIKGVATITGAYFTDNSCNTRLRIGAKAMGDLPLGLVVKPGATIKAFKVQEYRRPKEHQNPVGAVGTIPPNNMPIRNVNFSNMQGSQDLRNQNLRNMHGIPWNTMPIGNAPNPSNMQGGQGGDNPVVGDVPVDPTNTMTTGPALMSGFTFGGDVTCFDTKMQSASAIYNAYGAQDGYSSCHGNMHVVPTHPTYLQNGLCSFGSMPGGQDSDRFNCFPSVQGGQDGYVGLTSNNMHAVLAHNVPSGNASTSSNMQGGQVNQCAATSFPACDARATIAQDQRGSSGDVQDHNQIFSTRPTKRTKGCKNK